MRYVRAVRARGTCRARACLPCARTDAHHGQRVWSRSRRRLSRARRCGFRFGIESGLCRAISWIKWGGGECAGRRGRERSVEALRVWDECSRERSGEREGHPNAKLSRRRRSAFDSVEAHALGAVGFGGCSLAHLLLARALGRSRLALRLVGADRLEHGLLLLAHAAHDAQVDRRRRPATKANRRRAGACAIVDRAKHRSRSGRARRCRSEHASARTLHRRRRCGLRGLRGQLLLLLLLLQVGEWCKILRSRLDLGKQLTELLLLLRLGRLDAAEPRREHLGRAVVVRLGFGSLRLDQRSRRRRQQVEDVRELPVVGRQDGLVDVPGLLELGDGALPHLVLHLHLADELKHLRHFERTWGLLLVDEPRHLEALEGELEVVSLFGPLLPVIFAFAFIVRAFLSVLRTTARATLLGGLLLVLVGDLAPEGVRLSLQEQCARVGHVKRCNFDVPVVVGANPCLKRLGISLNCIIQRAISLQLCCRISQLLRIIFGSSTDFAPLRRRCRCRVRRH
mmetsp:Transcript_13376/g.28814  ORF Transcript_13376/g.28814 Transcript_13376/m.28814 type:complete len:511 (-) Transcript_13376:50-1582(-)